MPLRRSLPAGSKKAGASFSRHMSRADGDERLQVLTTRSATRIVSWSAQGAGHPSRWFEMMVREDEDANEKLTSGACWRDVLYLYGVLNHAAPGAPPADA